MKKVLFLIPIAGFSQNKKEQITTLNFKLDSLTNKISNERQASKKDLEDNEKKISSQKAQINQLKLENGNLSTKLNQEMNSNINMKKSVDRYAKYVNDLNLAIILLKDSIRVLKNENDFLKSQKIKSFPKTDKISEWLDNFEIKSLLKDSNWSDYWGVWMKEKTTYYTNNMVLSEDTYGNFCIENLPFNKLNDVMSFINSIKQIYDIDGTKIKVSDRCRYYYKNNKKICWHSDEAGPCSEINIEDSWPNF